MQREFALFPSLPSPILLPAQLGWMRRATQTPKVLNKDFSEMKGCVDERGEKHVKDASKMQTVKYLQNMGTQRETCHFAPFIHYRIRSSGYTRQLI